MTQVRDLVHFITWNFKYWETFNAGLQVLRLNAPSTGPSYRQRMVALSDPCYLDKLGVLRSTKG